MCGMLFTCIGVVQSQHASSLVVVRAPKKFLALKFLDWNAVFFWMVGLGSNMVPCPFLSVPFGDLYFPFFLLPCCNTLIVALMVTIFSCCSVGLPNSLSSSNKWDSYLLSALIMSWPCRWHDHHQLDFSCPWCRSQILHQPLLCTSSTSNAASELLLVLEHASNWFVCLPICWIWSHCPWGKEASSLNQSTILTHAWLLLDCPSEYRWWSFSTMQLPWEHWAPCTWQHRVGPLCGIHWVSSPYGSSRTYCCLEHCVCGCWCKSWHVQ